MVQNLSQLERSGKYFQKIRQKEFPILTNEMTIIRRENRSSLFMNNLTKVSPITSLSDAEMDTELVNVNPFSINVPPLYLMKTSDVFRSIEVEHLLGMG